MIEVLVIGSGDEMIRIVDSMIKKGSVGFLGVVNLESDAVTRQFSELSGIPVFEVYDDLLENNALDYILDFSSDPEIYEDLMQKKSPGTKILTGESVRFVLESMASNFRKGHQLIEITRDDMEIQEWNLDQMNEAVKMLYVEMEEKKERAEKINNAVSNFLLNVSKEMRTPLNTIMGFSNLLSGSYLEESQKIYVNSIQENGKTLQSFIEQILDISRLATDEVILDQVDFELENLVDSVVRDAQTRVGNKDLTIRYNFSNEFITSFKGDPSRIRQILVNLLSNAIKYTPSGEIEINIGYWKTKEEDLNDNRRALVFSVRDTGIGIPPDKLREVLKPFMQIHEQDKSITYSGPGLGLTIVRALIKKMGGDIQISSELEKGSEVVFTITLEEAAPIAGSDIVPLRTLELKDHSVTIVDSNAASRDIISKLCSQVHMKIVGNFPSHIAAVESFEKETETPDLIIAETSPGSIVDGIPGVIHGNARFKNTKIIGITSDPGPGTALETQRSGYNGYLSKPVNKDDLRIVIQTILGDKRKSGQIITRHLARELFLKGCQVLVAESNPVNRNRMKIQLEKLGVLVETATEGPETINCYRNNNFDLVIMDIGMPGLDGIGVVRHIRESEKEATPVMGISRRPWHTKDADFDVILEKPLSIKALVEHVAVLDERKELPARE